MHRSIRLTVFTLQSLLVAGLGACSSDGGDPVGAAGTSPGAAGAAQGGASASGSSAGGAGASVGGAGVGGNSAGTSGLGGAAASGNGGAGGAAAGAGGTNAGGTAGATNGGGTAGVAGAEGTPNLFTTVSGKTQTEVDEKVQTAVNRFFGIGTAEPATPTAATGYRCYYELPNDPSQAFIWAPDSNDIRSEGMSYGMMIAVQMDLHEQFDKLWKFSKTHMQYPANSPTSAWRHYFRWQGTVNGSAVSFGSTVVPAPDGEEYFAAALYLADQRWGSAGAVNYKQEADNVSTAMLHNVATADGRYPIIHTTQKMVVFVPYGNSNGFTDPSYHVPAFYELFATYGPAADSATWRTVATTSRNYFVASAHPTTGLHADYATFAGAPTTGSPGDGHDQFKYDAWRVVMNMAVDYSWFSKDAKLATQVEKYHAFFANHLGQNNVSNALFYVDGSNPSGGGSTALTATLAAGALASQAANRKTYVDNLWSVPQQSGPYRYYQESVYLLGLLAVAGKYRYGF